MKYVLLDLGNVVLGVDFRRVFTSWSQSSGVPEERFYERWQLDDAYASHEIGAITFAEYADHLSRKFEASMSLDDWRTGWNDLWTAPFHDVISLLPDLAERHRLFAFTNTNDTHAECWRALFDSELVHFEEIFVSSEIGVRKPHASAYLHVCGLMDADPTDVLFVDDTHDNISGAKDAGVNAHHAKSEAEVVEILKPLLAQ